MTRKYEVGQRVWIYYSYRRSGGPEEGVVTKVGRSLVTVAPAVRPSSGSVFRIESGSSKDGYGNSFIRTDEDRDRADRKARAWETLHSNGLERRFASPEPSLEVLEAVAALLDATVKR